MINFAQYRFLKRIQKQHIDKDSLSPEEFALAKYLVEKNMLEFKMTAYKKGFNPSEYCLKITPFGESVASNYLSNKLATWVPISISIVALVFSFIALFK